MPEAKINETCIIGLPTCGDAFSHARMAFVATPADEEFSLELQILETLLQEKDYEASIALHKVRSCEVGILYENLLEDNHEPILHCAPESVVASGAS